MWGGDVEEDVALDPKKLMEALRKEDARLKEGDDDDDGDGGKGDRKRGYNVNHEVDVTEEEMEAYRLKRSRKDDPMNAPDAGTKGYDLV
jgi:pre-mRNA-processing factor SLU7